VLRRPDTAVTILEPRIADTPADLTWDRGHLTAKLAVAVIQASGPDPALLGLAAADAASQTGSARILGELRALDTQLTARYPARRETRDFRGALAAATR
jgi:hypothetical protein